MAEFSWLSFAVHNNKVIVHGVTSTGMGGLSECVLQKNGKTNKDEMEDRGCVKVAFLESYDDFPKLLSLSIY